MNELCYSCREWVKRARQIEKDLSATSGDRVAFVTKERDYAFPYIACHGATNREVWQKSFHELQELLSIAAPDTPYGSTERMLVTAKGDKHDWNTVRLFNPLIADRLDKLYRFVQTLAEENYEAGIEHGRSLLMQLASGEMTMKDFDDTLKNQSQWQRELVPIDYTAIEGDPRVTMIYYPELISSGWRMYVQFTDRRLHAHGNTCEECESMMWDKYSSTRVPPELEAEHQ